MKRIIAMLLALALAMCGCCLAEGKASLDEQAKSVVSMIDYLTRQSYDGEQIFIGYQVVEEGAVFGFGNADNSITVLVIGDPETNELLSLSFICDVPEKMQLAMNCCCALPLAQMTNDENEESYDAVTAEMVQLASFFDGNYEAVLAAFEGGESFFLSFTDSDFFNIEWSITPVGDGARMLLAYYFDPVAAE